MTPEQEKAQQAALQKEADEIQAAEAVKALLALPAMAAALKRIERAYFEEFKQADDDTKRQNAWAKSAVLQDFLNEIQGVKTSGLVSEARRNTRHAAEARVSARTTRK